MQPGRDNDEVRSTTINNKGLLPWLAMSARVLQHRRGSNGDRTKPGSHLLDMLARGLGRGPHSLDSGLDDSLHLLGVERDGAHRLVELFALGGHGSLEGANGLR
jgi:hypothetical protein